LIGAFIAALVGVALFVTAPIGLLWLILDGLRKGVVRARGGFYARDEAPIAFWLSIMLYAVVATVLVCTGVRMVLLVSSFS
jgi:hypothetical protein